MNKLRKISALLVLTSIMFTFMSITQIAHADNDDDEETPPTPAEECEDRGNREDGESEENCVTRVTEERRIEAEGSTEEVEQRCGGDGEDPCAREIQQIENAQAPFIARAEEDRETRYQTVISDFGTCAPTDASVRHNQCNVGTLDTTEDKWQRLQEALINTEIMTTLEEPIGTENIFKRARVCKTQFLKDKYGFLQTVDGRAGSIRDHVLEGVADADWLNGQRYLITTEQCEQFFVESCKQVNQKQSAISGGQALPIQVFCNQVQVIFATSGSGIIKAYVGLVYRWATGLIGVIAVLVIVINGIAISIAGGDQGKVESAKNRIVQSLMAVAILFLAGIILYTVNPNYFTADDVNTSTLLNGPDTSEGSTPSEGGSEPSSEE